MYISGHGGGGGHGHSQPPQVIKVIKIQGIYHEQKADHK